MRFTFLGTGTSQGIPVIGCGCAACRSTDPKDKRLRTSGYLQHEGKSLLFDCGPDFRQQMLQNGFDRLDGILLTHEHNDHIIGLDDVRPLNFRQKIHMPIYGLKRTLDELETRFAYAFETRPYPGAPRLELFPIQANEPFHLNGLKILPLEILHGDLPVLGFRIGGFCYITDAKSIPEVSFQQIQGCHTLVVNALRFHQHNTHFSFEEALAFIEEIRPKRAYLTHLSHIFPPHEILSKQLPQNVFIGYDGLSVMID